MINFKFKPLLPAAMLFLGCCSLPAFAQEVSIANPCGELHKMGHTAKIYNPSDFDWTVRFTTEAFNLTNAGAVKYLDNGVWQDTGTGDYRRFKTYDIPVPKHDNVEIVYCGSNTNRNPEKIQGTVSFQPTERFYANHIPQGNIYFRAMGLRNTPKFQNSGTTSFVNYNRTDTGELVDGNITICPNDAQCLVP